MLLIGAVVQLVAHQRGNKAELVGGCVDERMSDPAPDVPMAPPVQLDLPVTDRDGLADRRERQGQRDRGRLAVPLGGAMARAYRLVYCDRRSANLLELVRVDRHRD